MPVAATYPGVYIEEIPSGVRTITGVATSITAFIGKALRGPTDQADHDHTASVNFERIFGETQPRHHAELCGARFFSQTVAARRSSFGSIKNLTTGEKSRRQRQIYEVPRPDAGSRLRGHLGDAGTGAGRQETDPSDANLQAVAVASRRAGGSQPFDLETIPRRRRHRQSPKPFPQPQSHDPRRSARRADTACWGAGRVLGLPLVAASQRRRSSTSAKAEKKLNAARRPPPPCRPTAAPPKRHRSEDHHGASDECGGTSADDSTPPSAEQDKRGLYPLEQTDLFNLLCIPPDPTGGDVEGSLVSDAPVTASNGAPYCQWIRPPGGPTSNPKTGVAAIGTSSKNAAIIFPRINQPNPSVEAK